MVRFLLNHQQAYRNEDDDEDNDEDNGNKEPKQLAPITRGSMGSEWRSSYWRFGVIETVVCGIVRGGR